MIVMKRTLKTILTMTNGNKNKVLWMITLKMLTMTMIYEQDLTTIIENKNKSDFLNKGYCNGDKEDADNSKIVVW